MLEALIFVCVVGAADCETHAFWMDKAPGRYEDNDSCHQGALVYMHTIDFEGILEPAHSYQVIISCRMPPL
jgi:hypothetical protein